MIRACHQTYQSPLRWDEKREKFLIQDSRRYKFFSRLVLVMDVTSVLVVGGMAITNYVADLDYAFTLLLLFLLPAAIENALFDIHSMRTVKSTQQLMNSCALLLKPGKMEMRVYEPHQ